MKLYFLCDSGVVGRCMSAIANFVCEAMHCGFVHWVRDGERSTVSTRLGEGEYPPVHVEVNAYGLAQAFYSQLVLFVSEAIREKLRGLPNLEFKKVIVDKLIDVPWKHGDVSMVKGVSKDWDMEKFFKKAKAVAGDPELHIGAYYQAIYYHCRDYKQLEGFEIKESLDPFFLGQAVDRPFAMKISPEYLAKYPISYCNGFTILSPEAWAILGEHLTVPYYQIRRITVDDSGKASVEKIEMPRTWPCEEDAASPQENDPDESQETENDEEVYDEGEADPEFDRLMTPHMQSVAEKMEVYMQTHEYDGDDLICEVKRVVEAEDFSDIPYEYDLDEVKKQLCDLMEAMINDIEEGVNETVQRIVLNLRHLPQSLDSDGLIFPPEGKSAQDYYNELMAGEVAIIRKRDKLEDNDVYMERLMEVEKEAFEKVYPRLKAQWQVRQKGLKIFKRGFPSLKSILEDMGVCG